MRADSVRSLWGQEFRVVTDGLAETDVVVFVEKLMNAHQADDERLQHLDSLGQLAKKTVEDAERLATSVQEEGLRLAQDQSGKIITAAQRRAELISREAGRSARQHAERLVSRIMEEAQARLADLEAELAEQVEMRLSHMEQTISTWLDSVRPLVAVWNLEQFNRIVQQGEALLTLRQPIEPPVDEDPPDDPGPVND